MLVCVLKCRTQSITVYIWSVSHRLMFLFCFVLLQLMSKWHLLGVRRDAEKLTTLFKTTQLIKQQGQNLKLGSLALESIPFITILSLVQRKFANIAVRRGRSLNWMKFQVNVYCWRRHNHDKNQGLGPMGNWENLSPYGSSSGLTKSSSSSPSMSICKFLISVCKN